MDPDETLRRWREARGSEKREYAGALRFWLRTGGFEPKWQNAKERAEFASARAEFVNSRSNPSMSMWEWLGLGTLSAIVLYAIFKPGNAEGSIVPATGGQTPVHPTSSNPVRVTAPRIPSSATAPTSGLTAADREVIQGIQDRLRAIGYQPGPSTGDWNHDTNYALAYFQRAEGLPATGVLTGATATRLAAVYERKMQRDWDGGLLPGNLEQAWANEGQFWINVLAFFGADPR